MWPSCKDKRGALRQKTPLMIRVLGGLEQTEDMIKILNAGRARMAVQTPKVFEILVLCIIRDERSFMLIRTLCLANYHL
jgi:hypothetical protein